MSAVLRTLKSVIAQHRDGTADKEKPLSPPEQRLIPGCDFQFTTTLKDGSTKATAIRSERCIDAWIELLHIADIEGWQVKNISFDGQTGDFS